MGCVAWIIILLIGMALFAGFALLPLMVAFILAYPIWPIFFWWMAGRKDGMQYTGYAGGKGSAPSDWEHIYYPFKSIPDEVPAFEKRRIRYSYLTCWANSALLVLWLLASYLVPSNEWLAGTYLFLGWIPIIFGPSIMGTVGKFRETLEREKGWKAAWRAWREARRWS